MSQSNNNTDYNNDAELDNNMRLVNERIVQSRPKNTQLVYLPKQKEFGDFCREQQFRDGETVTEKKLLLFLNKKVIGRPLKRRSQKAAPGVDLANTHINSRTVKTYVTAITDLWQQQHNQGENDHPSPREHLVANLVSTVQADEAVRNRLSYADKGQGTILDGYTEDELRNIVRTLWARSTQSPDNAEQHLRTVTDLLLGHYMLSRGESRREAEISDLFTLEFPGEGPTPCMPLIFVSRSGKTNQHGRVETSGAFRSRDPELCLLGALGFYFLLRWGFRSGESMPDFESRQEWYYVKVLKASDPVKQMAYSTQLAWINRAYEWAGVVTAKKTHANRSSGAKIAELKGVSESQIRRAGHWNTDQMTGCYLNTLPRQFMRVLAGHPEKIGSFFVARAVPPPPELLSLVWPELDRWSRGPDGRRPTDIAGNGTLNLMFYLREVVLQDSAILRDRHPVWNHPVFQHPQYQPFARLVLERSAGQGPEPDRYALIDRALPELTGHIVTAAEQQAGARADLASLRQETANIVISETASSRAAVEAKIAAVEAKVAEVEAKVEASQAAVEAKVAACRADISSLKGQLSDTLQAQAFMLPAALRPGVPPPFAAGPLLPHPPPPAAAVPPPVAADIPPLAAVPPPLILPPATPAAEAPPQRRMNRGTNSVDVLWREWTTGLNGQPSISELDERWGSRWRAGRQSEVEWYSTRREVIREIRRISQSRGITELAAMHLVARQHQDSKKSLAAYCKLLRRNKKERERAAAAAAQNH